MHLSLTFMILAIILILLSIGCFFNYQKFKSQEIKKFELLILDLEKEKEIKFKMILSKEQNNKTYQEIDKQLLKIKIDIFNLNFTFDEIFY